jgi:multiple sugar transport system substrate-binding protein
MNDSIEQSDTSHGHGISRRELIKRGLAAGVSIGGLGPFLAASISRTAVAADTASEAKFGKLAKNWSGTTLNVSLVAEARSDGLKQIVKEFTDATGIKVNINIYPYPTLQERQFTAVNQRTGNVDIVHVDCVWMGQYAGQGWLHPVTDFVKQTDPEVLSYDDFIPQVLQELCVWENTLYGLPFITAVFTLYYRKDIFEKHGLQPPQTWEELREIARQIHEKESRNGISGLTMMAKRGVQLVCTHLNVFGSMGGYYYDKKFVPTMASDAGIKSIEYLRSLVPFCNEGVLAQDYDESAATFKQGHAAMNLQWQNAAPQFVGEGSKITETVAITQVPGVKQGSGVKRTATTGGWDMGIVADSKNKEAAWEFIVWATSKDLEKRLAKFGTGARSSTLSDPELGKKFIEYPATFTSLKESLGRPRIPQWVEMSDLLAAQLSNVMTGQATAKDALDRVDGAFKQLLQKSA